MKKILLFASALAGLFLAGSCQRESLEPEAVGVTYTINLPEVAQTKGNSGYTGYDLYYEVYKTVDPAKLEQETTGILFEKKVEMTDNTVTLTLDLLNDQDYTILFWANKKGIGDEVFDRSDLREVKIKSSLSNKDDRDAFCGMDQLVNYDAATGRTVTLTRPFAQLNIATLVSTTAGYDMAPKKSYVKVTNVPTVFNVLTSEASGDAEVEFDWASVPEGKKVNDKYDLVAMNYVLVPESNVYVYYEIETANGTVKNSVDNVPLKPNYRTNIVGNLLTSNATYTIELKPGFEGESVGGTPFYDVPEYDEDTKTWTITKASELAWVAASVNGTIGVNTKSAATSHNFKGETIKLSADIDLENKPWTPIGTVLGESRYTYGFAGTFDGNGKTIKNLKVDYADCAGLFGNMCGGTIKNLTIDGFDLNSDHYAGAILGWGETGATSIVIENCKALNGKIKVNVIEKADGSHDLGDKAGAIVGFSHYGIYTGNEAQNVEIVGYRDLGGIVGYGKNTIVKNCKVTEVALRQDLTIDYKKNEENGSTPTTLDDYIGRKEGTCTIEGNEGTVTKNTNVVVEVPEGTTPTEAFAAALETAVAGDEISLPENVEINLPALLALKDNAEGQITITGAGESSVLMGKAGSGNNPGNYANGLDLVFKDITYMPVSGYSGGFGAAKSVTFINCKIIGEMYAQSWAPHYFYNCTIDTQNGYIYTWNSNCEFVGCTFAASEGRALQVFGDGPYHTNVLIKDCKFIAAKPNTTYDGKPVTGIDINSANGFKVDVTVTNCTTTGFPTGLNSGSDLYNIKDGGDGKVNLVIDGVYVARAGYTQHADYPNIWVKDNNFYVYDLDGLKDLQKFFADKSMDNSVWGRTYNICEDIDAAGYTWNGVYMITGDNTRNGIVIDGNGKTITNLTIKDYLLSGTADGADDGTAPGEIRNITLDNATVTGGWFTAPFWGNLTGDLTFTNVHVLNSQITGTNNVGGLLSSTGEGTDYFVVFDNCSVENTKITANGAVGQDPTGASGFFGRAFGETYITFKGNNVVSGNTITNNNGLVGGKVYGYTTWYGDGFKGTGSCDQFKNWEGISFKTVSSSEEMKDVLTAAGAAGSGNTTILFDGDIDMTDKEWTPIKVDGYRGAGVVVIDGNGAVITGLTSPLFAGGFAGGSGIVIRNLTIADSDIVSTNSIGSGAFIDSIDSMPEITLENCHLLNSIVTGGPGSRTGGLIGWTAGYNNQNDGPVKTYVKINNCSVVESTIQCDGSVGAIYGHAGNNAWTFSTVENCTVKDCTLNSTDDGGWRVGVVVGTANVGELTINNITESGNTLTQTGKTAPTGEKRNYYGRFVPGETGKLTIDGVAVTE